jgi:genome maintenance exonuclease 1
MKHNPKFIYPKSMRSLIDDKRHYEIKSTKLPSVTTILSATMPEDKKKALDIWKQRVGDVEADKIKNEAANRGTAMHSIIEKYLEGQGYLDLTDVGHQAHTMATQIIENGLKNKLSELWGIECCLYYPDLWAGQTDVCGIYEDGEAIIDFKQSNKPKRREWIEDYKLQLAAYALAHNEIYGTNIQKGVNLICTKDNLFQKFVFEGEEFKQAKFEWLRRVDQYYNQIKK